MIEYNVQHLSAQHNFVVTGVSYIGNPKPHTAMFVTGKVSSLLKNLNGISDCLIFAENGISVEQSIRDYNCILFSDCPQREYARFVQELYSEWERRERQRKYTYTKEGYYIGENVKIGIHAYIEHGCFIGHDVVIGDDACILSGAVIKRSVIGAHLFVNENAVIGSSGFTMTEDEEGNLFRIPTLGMVHIGNNVEIGAHDNISCGSSGNTLIEDYVKLDAFVHIGHDAHLGRNVEITAGSIIGGFAHLDCHTYIGLNATIRNRISLGANSVIGMGATVTKNVAPNITVAGNPAKLFIK